MEYISTTEAAKKWGISNQRVRVLCQNNRIEGAKKIGKAYVIPANAEKPGDPRKKEYKKRIMAQKIREDIERIPDVSVIKQCFEYVPDVFYMIDPDSYQLLYMNHAGRSWVGTDYEGEKCYRCLRGIDKPCSGCPIMKSELNNRNFHHEKLGRDFHLFGRMLHVGERNIYAINAFDITKEIEAQKEAERERRKYIDLYNSLPAGLVVYEKCGNNIIIVNMNSFIEESTEIHTQELVGENIEKLVTAIHPNDRTRFLMTLQKMFKEKEQQKVDFRIWNDKKKIYVWLGMTVRPGENEEDRQYGYANILDITKEYDMLKAVEENRLLLEKAELHSNVHYIDYDVRTKAASIGEQTARVYRLDSNILPDFPNFVCRPDMLYPDDYEYYQNCFNRILRGESKEESFNVRVMDPLKKKYRYRRVHFSGNYDFAGKLIRISGSSQDINQYVMLEERYRQALVQNSVVTWEYDPQKKERTVFGNETEKHITKMNSIFLYDRVHPNYIDAVHDIEARALAGEPQLCIDVPLWEEKRKKFIWYHTVITAINEPGTDQIQKYICTIRAI